MRSKECGKGEGGRGTKPVAHGQLIPPGAGGTGRRWHCAGSQATGQTTDYSDGVGEAGMFADPPISVLSLALSL